MNPTKPELVRFFDRTRRRVMRLRGFGRTRCNGERRLNAEPDRVLKCQPAVTLAIGITGKLRRAAEVEDTLLRIAKRPAALTALKIEERFRFVASVFCRHDLARTCGPLPLRGAADGNSMTSPLRVRAARLGRRRPKRKNGAIDGRRPFASACPACAQVASPRRG